MVNEFKETNLKPLDGFTPMASAKRAIFIAEAQHDGTIKFESAGMLFENSNPDRISTKIANQVTEEAGMNQQHSKSALAWVATVLPIIAAIAGATAWVNSTIDNKSRDNRLELKQDLYQVKQDLTASVDKLQVKVDSGFKDTSSQLNDIKVLIAKSDSQSNNK